MPKSKSEPPEPFFHPIGFIDTLAPPDIDLHATMRISYHLTNTYIGDDSFKEHVLYDLAHQMAALIKEKMDVFWRTLPDGDTEVEATVRVINTEEWRTLESRMFERYFEQRKANYTDAWLSKQKLLQTPYGSILKRTNPTVLPHCN